MYVVIKGAQRAEWLVVNWKSASTRIPLELTEYRCPKALEAVKTVLSLGAAHVVANCRRREDARVVARARNKTERWRIDFLKAAGK